MKKYLYLLLTAMTVVLSSCNKEDDIKEIFVGKTFYVIGYTINNTDAEQKDLGVLFNNGSGCYRIDFSSNKFTATLSNGTSFSGTWAADGRKKTMIMKIDNAPSLSTTIDKTLYSIIERAAYYEGDAHLVNIKDDRDNMVRMSEKR